MLVVVYGGIGMWRSKFQACLPSIGCLYVLKATDNPVQVVEVGTRRGGGT